MYKTYRNNYNRLLKAAEKNYLTQLFEDNRTDIRNTWKHINEHLGRSKDKGQTIPKVFKNDSKTFDNLPDI